MKYSSCMFLIPVSLNNVMMGLVVSVKVADSWLGCFSLCWVGKLLLGMVLNIFFALSASLHIW